MIKVMGGDCNRMRALDLSKKANFPRIPWFRRNRPGSYSLGFIAIWLYCCITWNLESFRLIWITYGLAYCWIRSVSCLLCSPVTFNTFSSCNLFYTFSCFKFCENLFIAVSTYLWDQFVGIVSFPLFNFRFFPWFSFRGINYDEKVIITFDFWSVESLEDESDFLNMICTF